MLGFVDALGRYADVSLHPSARITPGVVVYRLDDRLFFANANYVRGRIQEAIVAAPTETRWLVFDAESVTHVDSTGMEALADLAEELRRAGITLVVARLRHRMRDEFELAGVTAAIGADRFYESVERAVEAYDPPPSTAKRPDERRESATARAAPELRTPRCGDFRAHCTFLSALPPCSAGPDPLGFRLHRARDATRSKYRLRRLYAEAARLRAESQRIRWTKASPAR